MYAASVYNIMIGAPSDIIDEIKIAFDAINEWNGINSERDKIVLIPLHWSTNTYPVAGNHPQKSINNQITSKSDLMIGIFGTKFGTKTDEYDSGTQEEIEKHINSGKNVMLFFRQKVSTKNIDLKQYNNLIEFKNKYSNKLYWCEYNDDSDFKSVLLNKLQLFLNDNWLNQKIKYDNSDGSSFGDENLSISFDKKEINVLCHSKEVLSISGVDVSKCTLKIEDEFYASIYGNNGKIEITGLKVGCTKLIASYKNISDECKINVLPIYDLCGNPILEFNENMNYIKSRCNVKSINELMNNILIQTSDNNGLQINHYYFFKDKLLSIVCSEIIVGHSYRDIELLNCLNERFEKINGDTRRTWFKSNNGYWIVFERAQINVYYIVYGVKNECINNMLENLTQKLGKIKEMIN